MSFDDTILLKIKRDFSQDEAVKQLLKLIANLEFKVGVLKSEKAELEDKIYKLTNEGIKGKKLWLFDDVVSDLDRQLKKSKKMQKEINEKMNEWRNKYFSLLAKQNNNI